MSDEAVDLGGEMQLLVKMAMATERGRRDDVVEERKKMMKMMIVDRYSEGGAELGEAERSRGRFCWR